MLDPAHPIAQLLQDDRRYTLEAYVFIFEALRYAREVLEMGAESPSEAPARTGRVRRGAAGGAPRHRPGVVRGHSPLPPATVWLHGQDGVEQLGPPRHRRLRRDRLQPDPASARCESTPADTRVDFENVLRLRHGAEAGLQDYAAGLRVAVQRQTAPEIYTTETRRAHKRSASKWSDRILVVFRVPLALPISIYTKSHREHAASNAIMHILAKSGLFPSEGLFAASIAIPLVFSRRK